VRRIFLFLVVGFLVQGATGQVPVPASVKVNADRVNLRAKPDQQSETVGQVDAGTMLTVRSMGDDWVEVVPPEQIDFWVHQELVSDDIIIANKVNARSGAGINYTVSGTFVRGDKIQRRGSFGEWIKVAAPADARLWVSRSLVDIPSNVPSPVAAPAAEQAALVENDEPARVAPADQQDQEPAVAVAADEPYDVMQVQDEAPPFSPPPGLKLMPVDGQGKMVQREGLLKRAPALMFSAPGTHRLVKRDGQTVVTTVYLSGNSAQLNSLLDQQLLIRGREYWVEDAKVPLVVIEAIEKRSFY